MFGDVWKGFVKKPGIKKAPYGAVLTQKQQLVICSDLTSNAGHQTSETGGSTVRIPGVQSFDDTPLTDKKYSALTSGIRLPSRPSPIPE